MAGLLGQKPHFGVDCNGNFRGSTLVLSKSSHEWESSKTDAFNRREDTVMSACQIVISPISLAAFELRLRGLSTKILQESAGGEVQPCHMACIYPVVLEPC